MMQSLRDWMLERDKDAVPRLDSIRHAVIARRQNATIPETILEIFRPNLPAWTVLALAWIALAVAHLALWPDAPRSPRRHELANMTISPDEALSFLDPHT
jgi:hypothetical protein